jgi:hypothetical protein
MTHTPARMEADEFNGDTAHLIRCIDALWALDAKGSVSGPRMGGHARTLLTVAAKRLAASPASDAGAAVVPTRWGYGSDDVPNTLQPVPDGAWVYWEDVKHLFGEEMVVDVAPPQEAPQGQAVRLTNDDLKELAYSAYEEAMSFGLSHETFLRYFKSIRDRASIDSTPSEKGDRE